MAKRKKKSTITKFEIGDKVRVKHGFTDVEYPDMPMSGWAGTISEIHEDGNYTVRWSRETLDAIHPVFKKRCERDGMVLEEYWLGDDDLEPDAGGPLEIDHPKEIKTKPLSPKDQDDRIRMVFGLTSNDPLPDVDGETLETYHKYLAKNLACPFDAEYASEPGPFSSRTIQVKVTGLGDPGEPMIDDMRGIICEGKHERRSVDLPLDELTVGLVCWAEEAVGAVSAACDRSVASFTVQLNNLDPGLTFSEEELTAFLNDIRDSLQLPGFSWLLVGKKGLAHFITRRVPRLRSVVAHDVALSPLSLPEVRQVINKRITACALSGRKPQYPIEPGLLSSIYEASRGSLREIFTVCSKLCLAIATDPLYEKISEREASAVLAELLAVRFSDIKRSPAKRAILKQLSVRPGLTQGQLAPNGRSAWMCTV